MVLPEVPPMYPTVYPTRKLLRAVTYAEDPGERVLIGYFPEDAMRLAAECVWSEYVRATGPSTSNRR